MPIGLTLNINIQSFYEFFTSSLLMFQWSSSTQWSHSMKTDEKCSQAE